jgi:hypothetical protein
MVASTHALRPAIADAHRPAPAADDRFVVASASLRLSPCEAGGPDMLALQAACVADAAAQEGVSDALGRVLDMLIARNDKLAPEHRGFAALPLFEGSTKYPLSASAYIRRMLKYTNTSPCNVLIGLIYLQRLKDQAEGPVRLTSLNIQRLLLTATMLASKTHDDYFASNRQWALVGDLPLKELNELELDMLFHLRFTLVVTREEYDHRREEVAQLDPALPAATGAARAERDEAPGTAAAARSPAAVGAWEAYHKAAAGMGSASTSHRGDSPRSISSDGAHSTRSTVCEECEECEEDGGRSAQEVVISVACEPAHVVLKGVERG